MGREVRRRNVRGSSWLRLPLRAPLRMFVSVVIVGEGASHRECNVGGLCNAVAGRWGNSVEAAGSLNMRECPRTGDSSAHFVRGELPRYEVLL